MNFFVELKEGLSIAWDAIQREQDAFGIDDAGHHHRHCHGDADGDGD